MGKEKKRSDYHVRSVQRALHILSAFTNSKPYLGVSEIAEIIGIHKSTVHALLITLEDEGFISKDEEKNKYFLTYKLFQLGCVVSENVSILSIARPYMKQLCEETEQSVALNVISNRKRLILEVVENEKPMKLTIQPGQLLSLHSSAAGKVLLSGLTAEEFDDVVTIEGLKPMTPKTITDKKILQDELDLVRKRGYALCSGESYWAGSVSAPLRDHTGKIVASLCVYGPMQDFEGSELESYIVSCMNFSWRISQILGYSNH